MKKLIAMLVFMSAGTAFGATCADAVFAYSAAGASGTLAPKAADAVAPCKLTTSDGAFIKADFTFNQSADVGIAYTANASTLVVNSGHRQGKYSYGATSAGGQVAACTAKAADKTNGYAVATPAIANTGCN